MGNYIKKPDWLKIKLSQSKNYFFVRDIIKRFNLHTICEEAKCPNRGECWEEKSATIMILGNVCTRHCKFCSVKTGNPRGYIDPDEPERVAKSIEIFGLDYVVITSVNRDDLPDGGAEQFKKTIEKIRERINDIIIECLIPDFNGSTKALKKVVDAHPQVIGHNIETIQRLTPLIRDKRCNYFLSLKVIENIKKFSDDKIFAKTGFMVGLEEKEENIYKTLRDIKNAGADIVTIGQYLQPTKRHLNVQRFVSPEKFREYKEFAESLGLVAISGPFVRSSYKAKEGYYKARIKYK